MIADTIIPWVLGTLLVLTLIMFISSARAWREMKRSPYFFLRQQAEKRLQQYSSTSLVLLLIAVVFAAYAWRIPENTTLRVALLTNAKPPEEEIIELLDDSADVAEETIAETPQVVNVAELLRLDASLPGISEAELPDKFNRFEASVPLQPDTALGQVVFSTEVDDSYQAKDPGKIFPEGYFTLYATFAYEEMADGMAWSWVWRHNGKVVDGGNELWAYGESGPGYIFYGPEEGFQTGEYALDIWVNGEMMMAGSVVINGAAALSTGN